MIIKPDAELKAETEVVRGPNIKPLPINSELTNEIVKKVMIKVEDNITTDHIAPAGAKVLPYRSNIEKISEFIFMNVKASFHDDCLANNGGFIVAGSNYGQGSSREHAALAPMYLGIKAVVAKSFARIHRANLINFGIIPFTFVNEADYDNIDEMDELKLTNLHNLQVNVPVTIENLTKGTSYEVTHNLSALDIETILAGGTLNLIRKNQ
jgi:aconitate hydratase